MALTQFRWNPKTGGAEQLGPGTPSWTQAVQRMRNEKARSNAVGGTTFGGGPLALDTQGNIAAPHSWMSFGGMNTGGRGARIGSPDAAPSALAMQGRPEMGSLEGLYNLQRPGATQFDQLQERADFEQMMSRVPMISPLTGLPYGALRSWGPMMSGQSSQQPSVMSRAGAMSAFNPLMGAMSMIPGMASGGKTKAVQPYIVGERGPELMVPNEDGKVVPNDRIKEMIEDAIWEILPPMTKEPKSRYAGGSYAGAPGYGMRMPMMPGYGFNPYSMMMPWSRGGGMGMGGGMNPMMMGGMGYGGMMPGMYSPYGYMPQVSEFQMLQSPNLQSFWAANPNAPDMGLNSSLARYVRMGINNRARAEAGRAAVEAVKAQQAQAAAKAAADKAATAMDVPTSAISSAGPFGGMNLGSIYGSGGTNLPAGWRGLPKLAPVRAPADDPEAMTQQQEAILGRKKPTPHEEATRRNEVQSERERSKKVLRQIGLS